MKNDPHSCKCNYLCNCMRSLKKIQDFNRDWTHDLAILVRCSNQLSYEATDVGSWSIMFICVPVKEMNVIDVYEINHVHLSLTTIFHFGTLDIVFFFALSTVNRRRSNCVKEIERLKKNREERRLILNKFWICKQQRRPSSWVCKFGC